ncbi:cell division protein FtsZ [Candidatus Dojkabacteria bacterium]|jgi:cell division protein FtsZ|nr:cell division protein FtsZ [Candidatus Dojkabacteria bacterium]
MLVTTNVNPVAKIKVIGIGGAGGNTVNTMISDYNIQGVEFMSFNTDQQALKNSLAPVTLQLGEELTRGLGVGGDHHFGAKAAEESLDQIHEMLAGADMVFLTAGMGGGTGTGAAPVVAGVARNLGALTIAVVTRPFSFEGRHRAEVADEGIAELKDKVDTLIVVPNQRLLDIVEEKISFFDAMKKVDSVLSEGVKGISSLVTGTGFINVDFADVKAIMLNAGTALMGIGKASGDNRAEEAARLATSNPLLELSIEGATGVLYNITGGASLSMQEVDTAAKLIQEAVDPSANIIFGVTIDEAVGDELSITIIATGFDQDKQIFSKSDTPVVKSTNKKISKVIDEEIENYTDDSEPFDKNDKKAEIEANPVVAPVDTEFDDVPAFMRKKK